jgi:hypothetical protein
LKFALVNVSAYGTRTNADSFRGYVRGYPSCLTRQVPEVCLRVSARMVLSHAPKGRLLGSETKALRAKPKLDVLKLGSK